MAKSGNKECLKILIENEADFNCTANNKTELHYAARSGSPNLPEYLKEILKQKEFLIERKLKQINMEITHYTMLCNLEMLSA
ncbi:ankyrin repeat domain-containing protein [Wolbachia endosymbiont of Trichogramma kaykai]|uniref:ankyrin repeat domain-containing protein n=1 Tax=Wolbachia endosymbiont of Trichogramma kaykai TaxID=444066 RepID=UPI0038928518